MAKLLAAHSKKRKEGSSLTVIGPHRDLSRSPSGDSVDAMNLPAIESGKAGLMPVTLNIQIQADYKRKRQNKRKPSALAEINEKTGTVRHKSTVH
jgi:hypothetical protein